jgi:hypothetical protein
MPWLEPHAQGGLRSQQAIHDFGELGQTLVHDRPHDLQVNAEVAVDENVAHARHERPRDLRRLRLVEGEIRLAASPMTSRLRITASCSSDEVKKASLP